MIIYVFKKHENFLKTVKIVEFFLIIWGKLSELEPEPEFLTSWSRSRSWSRTKMDRLRNTAHKYVLGVLYCTLSHLCTVNLSKRAHLRKHALSQKGFCCTSIYSKTPNTILTSCLAITVFIAVY
jgi:hypothetical protein